MFVSKELLVHFYRMSTLFTRPLCKPAAKKFSGGTSETSQILFRYRITESQGVTNHAYLNGSTVA